MIRVVECETGYNTEKGVDCYEATKGEDPLVYQPLSTGITYQLIPKVSADGIPLHTMGYGRTSAANGKVFEWVFNYPANYWDGASIAVKHIMDEEGGDISGKKIALYGLGYMLFHDIMFHRRIRGVRIRAQSSYMKRIVRAHKVHHQTSNKKEGGTAFGFLYAGREYDTLA